MKQCKQCIETKQLDAFYKNGGGRVGYRLICKACTSQNKKNKRQINLQETRLKERSYRAKHDETNRIKEWRNNNKDKQRATSKRYYENNRDICIRRGTKYIKERRLVDIDFKLRHNISRRLNIALKNNQKTGSIIENLGCSIEELRIHLENRFQEGMSWENYGSWHIDHIKPLAAFDLTDENELKRACHYSNLQPLWAKDNLRKGSRYE